MKYDIQSLKEKLAQLDSRPNKKLGQNFLINKEVCEKIVEKTMSYNPKGLVEVGPGLGALTELLKLHSVPLVLVELDKSFSEYWQEQGFSVLHADALHIDWTVFEGQVLVSNLPYQISSTLVIDRSIDTARLDQMILMFQKEVAQRIMAKTKTEDYGLLSVIAQVFWKVDLLMEVGPKDFYPPPSIASRILCFEKQETMSLDSKKFLNFVKESFKQRRKLLVSNIGGLISKEKSKALLVDMGFSEMARPEELSPLQFVELFNRVQQF